MRLVHEPADERITQRADTGGRTLATHVETADSRRARARGLMFRRSIPDDYALVFRFEGPALRSLHMLFVTVPLDAVWIVDDEVQRVKRLRPWIGLGWGRADVIVELSEGTADGIAKGDRILIEDGDENDGV